MIEAETGIKRATPKKALADGMSANQKYPWQTVEVGQSFICVAKQKNTAYYLARLNTLKLSPKRFSSGMGEDGNMRIWRDA